jgi:hypothetical protein
MREIVQTLYNKSQRNPVLREVANFFMTREKEYQHAIRQAIEDYVARSERDSDGCLLVQEGLFAGLKYPSESFVWSEFAPRLAGSYEMELHPYILRWIKERRFTSFVDVGAAEGHYVAGFARLLPGVPVFAFEEKTDAHPIIRKLAQANLVDNPIQVLGHFEPDSLASLGVGDQPLVLVDIEGGELGLCESVFVESARRSCLIVEAHDSIVPRVSSRLVEAFRTTHGVTIVEPSRTLRESLKIARHLDAWELDVVLDERRGRGIRWLVMEPIEVVCAEGAHRPCLEASRRR